MPTPKVVAWIAGIVCLATATTAFAQNYGTDARRIAMGGNGGETSNIASGMVEKSSPYTVIVLPLGLIQLFKDGVEKFDPTNDAFNPVRAIEDASNPLHFTFGRGTTGSGQAFMNDIVNGRLNRNLASYAGFRIPTTLSAEGLASPSAGGTVKFARTPGGGYQGLYFGAGPYFGMGTALTVDPVLAQILGDGITAANRSLFVTNNSTVQLAMAITVGYRGRVALSPTSAGQKTRDGVYFAYNYHILKGFKYLNPDITVRFDTDNTGQLTLNPSTTPLIINSLEANAGSGRASDIGVQIVRGYFEVGFGVNGIGNRINWSDFSLTRYTLPSLTTATQTGQNFTETKLPSPVTALKVTLPVVKTANIGFQAFGWGALASFTHGYNGKSFHGGVERQAGPLWLRGGGKYTRGRWDPTYGFGIGNKVALDFGFYGTHANLEGKRQTSMAVSLRFNRGTPSATAK